VKSSGVQKRRARPAEPPRPLWGNFPLVPLLVLAGMILVVIGMITSNPARVLIGLGVGSLAGLELAVREHFSGYRSHTTLLAGITFVLVAWIAAYGFGMSVMACLIAGTVPAAVVALLLRHRFMVASGGLSFKLR